MVNQAENWLSRPLDRRTPVAGGLVRGAARRTVCGHRSERYTLVADLDAIREARRGVRQSLASRQRAPTSKPGLPPLAEESGAEMQWTTNPKELCRERTVFAAIGGSFGLPGLSRPWPSATALSMA
jgi:hypothetical protein